MTDLDIAKKALVIGLENAARIMWDSMTENEKQIYNNVNEFVEVTIRETIHQMAFAFGLMK